MFNTTEMNLMILYNPGTRLGLMEELGNMLGYLSGEETGLRRTTVGVIRKLQTMTEVIIPQAALVAVPSLGNSFISLLKDTSLVSSITVAEILMTAKSIIAVRFEPLLLYCEAAFVYLIFSTLLTWLQGKLEKKLGKHLVDTRV